MKLLFLSGSRSRAAGGVFEVEYWLARTLFERHDVLIEAAGYQDSKSEEDSAVWHPIKVHCFGRQGPRRFGYSDGLRRWLKDSDHDILHLHTLWLYTSLLTLSWHNRTKRPFIVSPHGMLDPWALKNAGWKKKAAEWLYERKMLRRAAVLHAFHEKDLCDFRAYGLKNPIAVIPNGVELPEESSIRRGRERTILFLGRIHPKKGLHQLLEGWKLLSNSQRSGWKLLIAGWDDGGYLSTLQALVKENDLSSSIDFVGPVFGNRKMELMQTSSALILPSLSEGLPMTVLEAWSHSLPVLMTEMCNLPRGFESRAALKILPEPSDIARGLCEFFSLSDDVRRDIGLNGRTLVEAEFTWQRVSDQFQAVYRWILSGGEKPSCVHLMQDRTKALQN